jgi:F-type H+-transporting ATPase subunit gamma
VITSDRGLCGAFNANVVEYGMRLLKEKTYPLSLLLVGRKGIFRLRGSGYEIIDKIPMPEIPTLSFSQAIGNRVGEVYINGECDEVSILYNEFITILKQKVRLLRLLPIEAERPSGFITEHLYEPTKGAILGEFLPHYIGTRILYALLHSSAAEHAARMLAMDNATKNASEMIDELILSFNKARQASITKEMIEITTSLEAMSA